MANCVLPVLLVLVAVIVQANAWSGNIESYYGWEVSRCKRCICEYSWGCSAWRFFRCSIWVKKYRCQTGWKHNGNQNCNIPICLPGCNGGKCIRPNECQCPSTLTGQFCQTLTCSYQNPCYPGNCMEVNKCNCTQGFQKTQYPLGGCLRMTDVYTPYIGRSTTIISNIRRTDNKLIYFFQLDGEPEDGESFVVWSNQKDFNTLSFLFESKFPEPDEFPTRPSYVHEVGIGILTGSVTIGVTDYKGSAVDRANMKKECGSGQRPENAVFNCTILDQEFRTNMEHGDTLKVTYSVTSGGFRQMIDLDNQGALLPIDRITGHTASKHIMFKFDLIAPKHCSEDSRVLCGSDDELFEAVQEFTKEPIIMRWKGWFDDMYGAGMWQYYLELHRLVVKPVTGNLTEENPVRPKDTALVMHQTSTVMQHTFQVTEPGVYSHQNDCYFRIMEETFPEPDTRRRPVFESDRPVSRAIQRSSR